MKRSDLTNEEKEKINALKKSWDQAIDDANQDELKDAERSWSDMIIAMRNRSNKVSNAYQCYVVGCLQIDNEYFRW